MIAAIFPRWYIWLPICAATFLASSGEYFQFILALLATQAIIAICLSRSALRECLPDVARTQALFWTVAMILQCLLVRFVRLFDSIALEFPWPTAILLEWYYLIANFPFVSGPLVSTILLVPHLLWRSEEQRRLVKNTEYAISFLLVPLALFAMAVPAIQATKLRGG